MESKVEGGHVGGISFALWASTLDIVSLFFNLLSRTVPAYRAMLVAADTPLVLCLPTCPALKGALPFSAPRRAFLEPYSVCLRQWCRDFAALFVQRS